MKFFILPLLLTATALTASAADLSWSISINGCSGAIFKMDGRKDSQKALVITNGHCLRLRDMRGDRKDEPGPLETVFDIRGEAVARSTFITLAKNSTSLAADRLIFATMNGTDIALFELADTYEVLARRHGVSALKLDSRAFQNGDGVTLSPGVYGRSRDQACSIAGRVSLAEGPYQTQNALRLSRECDIYHGFSGTPLVRADGQTFAGLANTHFDEKAEGRPCDFNKPCEVSGHQRGTPAPGQSYGVPTETLYTCYDHETAELNFKKDGCVFRPRSETESFPRLAGEQVKEGDPENATLAVIENKTQKCSGAFVAPDVILTAAHCLLADEPVGIAGDFVYPLSETQGYDPLRGVGLRIVKTIIHPKKSDLDVWIPISEGVSYPLDNPDFALLKLEKPYEAAVPAEISQVSLKAGDTAIFAGFGRGKKEWSRPDRIEFTILPDSFRAQAADYSDIDPASDFGAFMQSIQKGFDLLAPYYLFVRSPEPGVQTLCYGDSGGPLYRMEKGRMKIFGVTSQYFPHPNKGNPGCQNSFLGVFAKAAPHAQWLRDELSKLK